MPTDTYFRRAINWMYGDDAYLHQNVGEKEIGDTHINVLLGRHPYHPFDPEMKSDHPCFELNQTFFACMEADHVYGYELHQKHNACFFPHKTDLMKCLAREKRIKREQAQKEQKH
ncbi:hypothetical protein STCU_03030 [Strigomonas culicis]|uniref:Uncharacterized protein n=1 Tax=Strigomonas culicis TaxID=28005 RepID=S9UT53_9TRYP|nr:hypothetical protein STCU_03030 [Strigomonas culicis]|eukprot:EPY31994.1 hypothetical protein STCU_03030 [Strigomonas culicis]